MNTDRITKGVIYMLFGTIFFIIATINAFVYLYATMKDYSIIKKNQSFKRVFAQGMNLGKEIETTVKEGKTKPEKVGKLIGGGIAVLFLLVLSTIYLSIPLIIGFTKGFQEAIVAYFSLVILIGLLRSYIEKKCGIPKNHRRTLLRGILGLFHFQVIIIVLFGFFPNLENMILQTYQSTFIFKYTFTFLWPILFIALLVLNLYFYWVGLLLNSKQNAKKEVRIKETTMLLIGVFSSFAGIIYLIESDYSFIDMASGSPFDRLLNLFIFLLSSILIPLMFNLLSEAKKHREDSVSIPVVEVPVITAPNDDIE